MQTIQVQQPAAGAGGHTDIAARLDLPPDRYEIRVAITSQITGRTGSAYTTLIVPDFSRDTLTLSGLVMSRGTLTARRSEVIPLTPTTVREFERSDSATAFMRLYQGGKRALQPVRVIARIINQDDRTVFERTSIVGPDDFGRPRSTDYRLDLPIRDLPAGRYLFTVEATQGKVSAHRNVRLVVKQ
jgi:hypothetical protein